MSKLGKLGHFLHKADEVFLKLPPEFLGPLAPFRPLLKAAIAEAEAIPGASGHDKLQHVTNIVVNAAEVAQQSGKQIDPAAVRTEAGTVISAVVQAINLAHPVAA